MIIDLEAIHLIAYQKGEHPTLIGFDFVNGNTRVKIKVCNILKRS